MRREDADFYGCPIPFPTTVWRVKIVGAPDGDTLTLKRDKGDWETKTEDVRLGDIDVWEMRSGSPAQRVLGSEARQWVIAHCVGRWGLMTTRLDQEKYGRTLGTLQLWDEESQTLWSLSVALRENGFEKVDPGPTLTQ